MSDMSDLHPRRLVELVRSVALLALPSVDQRKILVDLGVAPSVDELALLFDDVVVLLPAFEEAGWLNAGELVQLREIERLLSALTDTGRSEVWDVEALDGSSWNAIRDRAQRFLAGS